MRVTYIEDVPMIFQEMPEFKALHETFTGNLEELWEEIDTIFDNQFIDTMTEIGCEKWEKVLGISPKSDATIEDRRSDIKVKKNARLPQTMRLLKEKLSTYLGEDGYEIERDLTRRILTVLMYSLKSQVQADAVMDTLLLMRPANMVLDVKSKKGDKQSMYVGHAVKTSKKIYVENPTAYDPLNSYSWYVDENDDTYIDHLGNILGT